MRLLKLFLILFSVSTFAQQMPERPNILLVMLDDVGFMGLGVYGSDAKTPNIDQIAHQGTQFTRYYTAAMFGPSRAMLMTGQDSQRHDTKHNNPTHPPGSRVSAARSTRDPGGCVGLLCFVS